MKDAITLVTGGAGHIGAETCRALAREGSHIAILDKQAASAATLAAELRRNAGIRVEIVEADIMDPASFAQVREALIATFGKLDHLVNCAAFYDDTPGWGVAFESESYEAWVKVMRVNTLAPFFLAQALWPLLKASGRGAIVNVSSIYGLVGPDHRLYEGTDMTNPAAYAASKGGLQQVTSWLSTVMAPHVRVNTVTPGGVERGQDARFIDRYQQRTPLRRMAKEDDIAEAIVYLLSGKAKYVTGHNLVVDGGWTAW